MKIDVTHIVTVVDLGEDEELGNMASEDNYLVVTGLPIKHIRKFWRKVASIHGCSRGLTKKGVCKDGRLRVNWNEFCDYENFLQAKDKILKTIKCLVPDARVRYRQLGTGLSEVGDYDHYDAMLLEGAFTDEERAYLPLDQRADILGLRRQP